MIDGILEGGSKRESWRRDTSRIRIFSSSMVAILLPPRVYVFSLKWVAVTLVPEGHHDNSPAFKRRETPTIGESPEGTADGRHVMNRAWNVQRSLGRPFGTWNQFRFNPALKRRAILDCPSGTSWGRSARPR